MGSNTQSPAILSSWSCELWRWWLGRRAKSRPRTDGLTEESSSNKDGHSYPLAPPVPPRDTQILADDLGTGVLCQSSVNLSVAAHYRSC